MASLMSPLDAIFMAVEKPANPMHIGGLHLFTPPEGASADDLAAMFSSPDADADADADYAVTDFFRRRAVRSWATAGQWAWQPDERADLGYHVRKHRLAGAGGFAELAALCAQLHATPLDRSRPLWQAHLISGLADGRFALYFKMHHALGDGQFSQRLLRETLSRNPSRRGAPAPWVLDTSASPASPTPSPAGRRQRAAGPADPSTSKAFTVQAETAGLASVIRHTLGRGLRNEAGPFSFAAPRSLLNPPVISAGRTFAACRWPTARIAALRTAASVTSNDVVLAMCSGALRTYLSELDALPEQPLIAMVPVALRETGVIQAGGNSVGSVMCSLATDRCDPAERLAVIHRWMTEGKAALSQMTSTQILAVTALGMSPLLIQPLLGRVARPPFNLIISNVSGPRAALYFNGARLDGVYPLSIPVDGQALNITCARYAGHLSFGITGCAATLPHLQRLATCLEESLCALERAVGVS